ncbi:PspC domain-containing protein [Runella sp.]|uniref:PspC domain-containing protein n=1 Tax=Runella sp. TaxID=1960881 RepID=UPI003D0AE3FA
MTTKQLQRIPSEGKIGGVAAGLADYFGIDTTLMRILWIASFFAFIHVPVIVFYIILWAIMPKGVRQNNNNPVEIHQV